MKQRPTKSDVALFGSGGVKPSGAAQEAQYREYVVSRLLEMDESAARAWIDSGQATCEIAALMRNRTPAYKNTGVAIRQVRTLGSGPVSIGTLHRVINFAESQLSLELG
jgi:hypothetical protein